MTEENATDIQVKSVSHWDDDFFQEFSALRNYFYQGQSLFIEEDPSDLKKELESNYFKKENVQYCAFILSRENEKLARLICYYDPNCSDVSSFGYFEARDDDDLVPVISSLIEKFTYTHKCKGFRGPLQGNFFFSYRMKISGGEPFYGEPYHFDYYPKFLEKMGMKVSKRWYTTQIDGRKTMKNFKKIRTSSAKKNSNYKHLKLKFIFPWRWEKYLETIYDLFMRSYKEMPEYTPIDFETFKNSYNGFKYILNPFFSYLIEYKGEPVAFCINFFDPLKHLYKFQNLNKSRWIKLPGFKKIMMAYLLIRLKFNFEKLLIMYVGRVPTSDGQEIKGIQALVSKYLGVLAFAVRHKSAFVCYSADDSPSNKSWDKDSKTFYSEYAMFYKDLS